MGIRFCRSWPCRSWFLAAAFICISFSAPAAGQAKDSAEEVSARAQNEDALSQAETLISQAAASAELGRYSQAMESGREALAIRTKELGDDDLLVAETLRQLGEYCRYGGQPGKAVEHLHLAIEILERSDDPEKSQLDMIKTLRSLGTACFQAKRFEEAATAFARILKIQESAKKQDWQALSVTVASLAFVLKFNNDFEKAEKQ